ncbi:MAG: hypothetical protein NTV24_05380 [Candidatus Woesebacteria bacterium]|nr:hypothetical protein [Candidatus Woesebacteria bacterium]
MITGQQGATTIPTLVKVGAGVTLVIKKLWTGSINYHYHLP